MFSALARAYRLFSRLGELLVEENFDRQAWMLALCERMLAFYPQEIRKIQERQRYFEAVKKRWDR